MRVLPPLGLVDHPHVPVRAAGGGQVDENQLPYATQVATKRNPVTLFSSGGCGEVCASARQLLASRGVPYSERNPQANPADADALKKLIGVLEVPVLLVGGDAICDSKRIMEGLGRTGSSGV